MRQLYVERDNDVSEILVLVGRYQGEALLHRRTADSNLRWQAGMKRREALRSQPGTVHSFLEDLQHLGRRWAEALLQTILQAAHIWRDGRIELAFRS